MPQISVTMNEETYVELMTWKPRYMKKSEWIRHLMMQQVDSLRNRNPFLWILSGNPTPLLN